MDTLVTRHAHASKFLVLAIAAWISLSAIAQQPAPPTPPAALPVYDIVSIHPHSTLDDNTSVDTRPGNFSSSNTSLKDLISYAYGIRQDLISGLPGWANTARFDITAKTSEFDPAAFKNLTRKQRESLLQPMLTERFHVKVHTEIKTLEVFNLVLTKDGPRFKPNPPPAPNADHTVPAGQQSRGSVSINNSDLTATGVPLSTLAEVLAGQLNHTVIDKTGLTGDYDFKLKWTPDRLQNSGADDGTENAPPDLFTAVQEQLGLKLDPAKGPVTTLVVDHAEQPTPN